MEKIIIINKERRRYSTNSTAISGGCQLDNHLWIYAGNPDYFPYEGMSCACGQEKWQKETIRTLENK